MLEGLLRNAMTRVVHRLQLHPRLERFHARVPYFIVVGMVTVLLLVPAAAIVLLAQALGYQGTSEMSLRRSWLTMAALPVCAMIVFALIYGVGWASGYRPFRRTWAGLRVTAAAELSERLRESVERCGFTTVWSAAPGAGSSP